MNAALASAEFRLCSGCSHRGFGCERLQGADSGRSLLLCQFKERPKAEVRAFELKHTKRTNLTTSVVKKKSTITKVIIANTTKGKGFELFENNPDWHYGIVTDRIMKQLT